MRPGKFSESVLKRSVLKQIKTKREEVNRGAEVGEDCALFSFEKKEGTLLTTAPIIVEEVESIGFQLTAIVNNVAVNMGVWMSLLYPDFNYFEFLPITGIAGSYISSFLTFGGEPPCCFP